MCRPQANPYSAHAEVVTLEIDVSPEKVPPLDAPPKAATGPARKVLLLDDRDDFRDILRDHLIFRGFQVTSGAERSGGIGRNQEGRLAAAGPPWRGTLVPCRATAFA